MLEQPDCFLHVTALQAGTDGERVAKVSGICWGTNMALGPSWLGSPPCLQYEDGRIIRAFLGTAQCRGETCSQNQLHVVREQGEMMRHEVRLKNT